MNGGAISIPNYVDGTQEVALGFKILWGCEQTQPLIMYLVVGVAVQCTKSHAMPSNIIIRGELFLVEHLDLDFEILKIDLIHPQSSKRKVLNHQCNN